MDSQLWSGYCLPMETTKRPFRVGVFFDVDDSGKRKRFRAYTTWFNEAWPNCVAMTVEATSGDAAKKMAIAVVRAQVSR